MREKGNAWIVIFLLLVLLVLALFYLFGKLPYKGTNSSPSPIVKGIPVGPYHYPVENYGKSLPINFKGGFLSLEGLTVEEAAQNLDTAKKNDMQILISITGGGDKYSDDNGNYKFELFKDKVKEMSDLDLENYYADGVVVGNIFMDEPQDRSNWNGTAVSTSQIKEAARYLKSVWPTVPVGVGTNPIYVADEIWSSNDLDFISMPFTFRKLCPSGERDGQCFGDTKEEWMENFLKAIDATNLAFVMSINVLAKDPNRPQYNNNVGIEVNSLVEYATYFLENDDDKTCALILWTWESDNIDRGRNRDDKSYFSEKDNPGITASLQQIQSTAYLQPTIGCTKH